MARPPHFDVSGAIYFITTKTREGKNLLDDEGTKRVVFEAISLKAQQIKAVVQAYVIMPNHYHLLLSPPEGESISKVMNHINGFSSYKANRYLNRKGAFWQGGFNDFTIINERKFIEKINYIHYNPVKRGLVRQPEEYLYSSARDFIENYGACVFDLMVL